MFMLRVLGDWRLFNWLIFSQMLFVVVLPIFMPESCRWFAKMPSLAKVGWLPSFFLTWFAFIFSAQMADVKRSRGEKCGNHEEDCKDEQERGLYQNCQAEKKMNKGSLIHL